MAVCSANKEFISKHEYRLSFPMHQLASQLAGQLDSVAMHVILAYRHSFEFARFNLMRQGNARFMELPNEISGKSNM